MRRFLKRTLIASLGLVLLLVLLAGIRAYFAFRDRNPGYALSLDIDTKATEREPRGLRAGFGRVNISPNLSDPKRPVWVAGFSQNRAATAVHDDLWAVACVIDDGYTRVGMVALDAIGFFNDDVVAVRRRLAQDLKLNYTIVASTHNHSTPDLMGLWGPNYLRTGVDPVYREKVIAACASSLQEAVAKLVPAQVAFLEISCPPTNLVADTRPPEVYDSDIRVMFFKDAAGEKTLGTLTTWGNHPETVWARNTEITSDFCGYLRDALEKGVEIEGKRYADGVGGVHMYVNGAVGGLMSTTPRVTVTDPYSGREYKDPTHDKARAVGHQLASRILPKLGSADLVWTTNAPLSVHARTLEIPLKNKGYLLAGFLGLLDRGHVKWQTLRSEVAFLTFGGASIACVPGEIYPEIINGGIEQPEGRDFDGPVVESPPIREMMPGSPRFVFGLANDEIGYILPKTQWDAKAPYTYGSKNGMYGEINSVGPDVAPILYATLRDLCQRSGAAKSP